MPKKPVEGQAAIEAAYAEIDRLEAMISSWRADSQTTQINDMAGRAPVVVPSELFNLVRRSLKVSELTGGAFDITFAGLGKLWDIKADPPRLPEKAEIEAALRWVDYRQVVLDAERRTVYLSQTGMRIGFGAIGKGYAANRALAVIAQHGFTNALVNAGGDLIARGRQNDGQPWSIGISHPRDRERIFAWLQLTEQAVVTSGDYERFITIDGVRYSHIISPQTGYPASELQSVTIICPDAELADALATATFVMGPKRGMDLVDKLKGVECLMIDAGGDIHYSRNIETQMIFPEDQP